MDETLLLEYALSIYDDNCSMKFAAHTFADNSYAFAVKPGSHIKVCNIKRYANTYSFYRQKKLDLYIDDSPLLEYALSQNDDNCSMKYAAHSFGENAYAFAVKPGSNIKVCNIKSYLCLMETLNLSLKNTQLAYEKHSICL